MATRPVFLPLRTGAPSQPRTQAHASAKEVNLDAGDFVLRSMSPADASPEIVEWFNNSVMLRGLNVDDLAFTLDSFRLFVQRFDNHKNFIIGIFSKETGAMVGFYTIELNLKFRTGTLTSGVGDQAFQGRGVLRQTVGVLLDEFFANRGAQKLSARVLARNLRMIFNFRSSTRFMREAVLKKELCTPQGERVDVIVFSAFAPGVLDPAPATRPGPRQAGA